MELSEKTFPSNLGIPHMTTLAAKSLGGGSYPSNLILYQAKQASGPNTSAGSKNPADSQNIEYWQVFSTTGSIPVGTIIWYSSSTAPIGYLICNGQAVSRTLYPDLFDAIGTLYGEGDGSTTFSLPNLIDKFIEGSNSSVGTNVNAGLPNIGGAFGWNQNHLFRFANGAFVGNNATGTYGVEHSADGDITLQYRSVTFDASQSNSIYGNSNTVQPPAVKLLPCIKAYSDVDNLGSCDVAQLENYVQNNVVHNTGDETVNGQKIFTSETVFSKAPAGTARLHIQMTTLDSTVVSTQNQYKGSINFLDKNSTSDPKYRTAMVQSGMTASDANFLGLYAYNPTKDSESANGITIYFYRNGISKAVAPSTLTESDIEGKTGVSLENRDILTRDWIPKDNRIVHTTGNEDITGFKRFLGNFPSIGLVDTDYDTGESKNAYASYGFYNKSGGNLCGFGYQADSTQHYAYINIYPNTATANNYLQLNFSYENKCFAVSGASTSNKIDLGRSGRLWRQLYAGTTTINTSDERLKNDISSIPDEILDVWGEINWKQFRFNDAVEEKGKDNTRLHTGLIAQELDRLYKSYNLDISKYGLFCYDEWDAEEEILDNDGKMIREYSPAGNQYSLRYEEALCMEAAYQRRRADRAEARIKSLEERLSLIESKLNIS